MLVSEIFYSIQGESTRAGLPCVFIRLAGCNLRCEWCDTGYAQTTSGAREVSMDEILAEVSGYDNRLVEITGGEPMLHNETGELARRLVSEGFRVLLETNGTLSLKGIDDRVVKIVDVKCPSSGHGESFLMENLPHLLPTDEIKFVVADRGDFDFALAFIEAHLKDRDNPILISPVAGMLDPAELARWMLSSSWPGKSAWTARIQLQLHRIIWPEGEGI